MGPHVLSGQLALPGATRAARLPPQPIERALIAALADTPRLSTWWLVQHAALGHTRAHQVKPLAPAALPTSIRMSPAQLAANFAALATNPASARMPVFEFRPHQLHLHQSQLGQRPVRLPLSLRATPSRHCSPPRRHQQPRNRLQVQ